MKFKAQNSMNIFGFVKPREKLKLKDDKVVVLVFQVICFTTSLPYFEIST
jgi:hypothetical protein